MALNTWFAGRVSNNWRPEDGGINELFKVQVRSVREMCATTKVRPGLDANGTWILYERLPHARTSAFIRVSRFTWLEFDRRGGSWTDYLTPVFRLQFEMAEAKQGRRRGLRSGTLEPGDTYYQDQFEIVFPDDFPWSPPNFRLDGVRGYAPSHDHHLNSGDWLCILAGSSDWNGNKDSVASGLAVAFDWAAWHYEKFERRRGSWYSW